MQPTSRILMISKGKMKSFKLKVCLHVFASKQSMLMGIFLPVRSLEKAKMIGVGEMHGQAEVGKYQEDSEGSDRENSTKGKRSSKKMKTSV
jgi:hypothetical protein